MNLPGVISEAISMHQKIRDEIAQLQKKHDPVNHPAHYKIGGIETIDFIEAKDLPYHLANVIKYVSRAGRKDGADTIQDLQKANWYLVRYIALLQKRADTTPSAPSA